jgi:hypothetical protein
MHAGRVSESSELRDLLNEWDPVGVYNADLDSPGDPNEYDDMNGPVLSRLRRGDTAVQVGEYLASTLRESYGLDPEPRRPYEFAARLARWFHARTA